MFCRFFRTLEHIVLNIEDVEMLSIPFCSHSPQSVSMTVFFMQNAPKHLLDHMFTIECLRQSYRQAFGETTNVLLNPRLSRSFIQSIDHESHEFDYFERAKCCFDGCQTQYELDGMIHVF